MSYLIGIDASTTATKAILVDGTGDPIATGVREYGYETPRPGWAEQHPGQWWEGAVGAIADVLSKAEIDGSEVAAVGLSGQMHGLVMLDAAGDVIRPAILWNDQRTADQCDRIRREIGPEQLVSLTGNDAMTGFTAPKLLWVRENEPEEFDRIASIMLPKDYVRFMLTSAVATDMADGSGTLLMDVANRRWSGEMMDLVGLSPGQMPELFEGQSVTGTVGAEAAQLTGLAPGTPVVAGGGDQAANAVGVGAVESSTGALSLGTSGVVFVASDRPVVEPKGRVHAFCHAVPGKWHAMGVMLSAAGSLRWFREALAPDVPFDELVSEASSVGPGADGLRFLPYLTGERTPHSNPHAKAAFVGLTTGHGRAHMTRAVLEGVAFGLADGASLMRDAGIIMPAVFNSSGGGTRSQLWRQIISDVLDVKLATVKTVEGAAFGAALLAGIGVGIWPDVTEAARVVERVETTEPGADAEAHAAAYASFRELYPPLEPLFPGLG